MYKENEKINIILTKEMAKQLNALSKLGFNNPIDMITSLVFESKEYDNFKKLKGNRETSNSNVTSKIKLLEKNGFKSSSPILINQEGEILDGQHRTEASKSLGIPLKFTVDYNINKDTAIKEIIDLNNSSKKWQSIDYVNAYAEKGNKEYKLLKQCLESNNINLSKFAILYQGHQCPAFLRQLPNGDFKFEVKKAEYAIKTFLEIKELEDLVPSNYKSLIRMEKFANSFYLLKQDKSFDFEILKKQFNNLYFDKLSRGKDITYSLFLVYNYNRRTKKAIFDPITNSSANKII